VWLISRVARAPEQHEQTDCGQNHKCQDKGNLTFNREHFEKSVTHSLFPLRL